MTEILYPTEETPETVQETPTQDETPTTPTATSAINLAIESVMGLIDEMGLFSAIKRGALGTGDGLSCEIAPSIPEAVFYDKNSYIPLTLALNGKHSDLLTLSDALNGIIDTLTRRTSYPNGNGWEIVDIVAGNLPRIIDRENNNVWLMACDLVIKIYRKDDEQE